MPVPPGNYGKKAGVKIFQNIPETILTHGYGTLKECMGKHDPQKSGNKKSALF